MSKRKMVMTERRRQIATLAAHGLSNRQIADKLALTEGSVKTHLYEIYQILHVRHRIELLINPPTNARLVALTDRKRQVASLVCRGLSNRQIGEKLGVSEGTIKSHLHQMYETLNVHSRMELLNVLA